MSHPAVLLLAAAAVIVLAWALFRPQKGLLPLLLRALRMGEREQIEDALKHLYDCEYVGTAATLPSLAGALRLSQARVAGLAARLEAMELVHSSEGTLRLTPAGRSYALRVIRIHRLWETYLADRTGHDEADWHSEADRREHTTSTALVEQMVRETGNPRFDPHGDPIPTDQGEVPARRGEPLSDLPVGSVGTIVHVEDEPEAIYAQLRAQNIRFRQHVIVVEKSPERIRVEVDGEEHAIAPVVAANVWVERLPTGTPSEPVDRLSSLEVGDSRTVVGISPVCQGLQRRRLLDLGLIPGTEVTAVMTSPMGDPMAYRIRGAVIALRREQADLVQVQPKHNGQGAS